MGDGQCRLMPRQRWWTKQPCGEPRSAVSGILTLRSGSVCCDKMPWPKTSNGRVYSGLLYQRAKGPSWRGGVAAAVDCQEFTFQLHGKSRAWSVREGAIQHNLQICFLQEGSASRVNNLPKYSIRLWNKGPPNAWACRYSMGICHIQNTTWSKLNKQ